MALQPRCTIRIIHGGLTVTEIAILIVVKDGQRLQGDRPFEIHENSATNEILCPVISMSIVHDVIHEMVRLRQVQLTLMPHP